MKQTAVGFLENQYNSNGKLTPVDFYHAKEMEKQQIIDAVEWGNRKGYDEHKLTCVNDEDEQYYKETFKKK
jgi:hypothetical protein